MKVKLKKLNERAKIPKYKCEGDAGLDLTATTLTVKEDNLFVYGTGIALEIPDGHVGLVFPRSSNCKTNAYLTNGVGVIDSKLLN